MALALKTERFRNGSNSDIATSLLDVRFAPKSGHRATTAACPLCADSVAKVEN
jgi:hypothetical protein